MAELVLSAVLDRDWRHLDSSLYAGLPGVALTLLAGAPGRPELAETARAMCSELSDRLDAQRPPSRVPTDRGGLFAGASGCALLALRLFDYYREPSYLALAEQALDYDLASLTAGRDGSLHVNEGWRLLPYLGYGSAGIGVVLAQFLTYVPGATRCQRALEGILLAASAPFTVQAGLMHGRAGLVYFLSTTARLGFAPPLARRALDQHVAALSLHAIDGEDGVRFAGNGLLRASCDLATGSAGVLAVLTQCASFARGSTPLTTALPFLEPLPLGESANLRSSFLGR
ncbi:lanthionine synthetase C family protein [Microbacterium sp. Sa4CUA7]|uniref:Lanthionine synthetase C family protein n=1 Tax=Microbacterium pullorum TaxID=2762236 RepID=A0ABR8S5W0_9MICO|nr:lanthionine synthetase C family protein [Microbacterium pullorum]MBD7958846.1 lanthionine synthetase C family protein [Microbacterium pullorum]